jgi:hypothetical protein
VTGSFGRTCPDVRDVQPLTLETLPGATHPASRSDFSAVSATLHPWSEIALASSEGRFRSDTVTAVEPSRSSRRQVTSWSNERSPGCRPAG